LEGTGALAGFTQPGRTVQIRERKLPFYPATVTDLEENLCDILQLYYPPEVEQRVLKRLISAGGLEMADRGSIYSEEAEQLLPALALPAGAEEKNEAEAAVEASPAKRFSLVTDLAGICCILPRGLGDVVARVALELGTCVPAISFGTGTGWRDRLGLLRVAIPAEKELVTLVVPHHDAEGLARRLVEGGRLSQPGRGFVYLYPIRRGLLNIQLWIGPQCHAASINQVVAAVDALWGGTGWRRRFSAEERGPLYRIPRFQHDLLELTLICPEGRTAGLVHAAMEAGSGGATSQRVVRLGATEAEPEELPAGRELTTMVIPARRRESVLAALRGAGLFAEGVAGSLLYVAPAPLAYSYTRRRMGRP